MRDTRDERGARQRRVRAPVPRELSCRAGEVGVMSFGAVFLEWQRSESGWYYQRRILRVVGVENAFYYKCLCSATPTPWIYYLPMFESCIMPALLFLVPPYFGPSIQSILRNIPLSYWRLFSSACRYDGKAFLSVEVVNDLRKSSVLRPRLAKGSFCKFWIKTSPVLV